MNLFEIDFNKDKKFVGEDFRYRRKLLVILFVCVFISALLLIRLFYLQIIKNKYYSGLSRNNKEQIIPIEAHRGEIYDRNGVMVAENVKVYVMYMIPVYLPKNYFEREELLYRVSKIFNIDLGQIKSILDKVPKNSYESIEIANNITMEQISYLAERSEEYPGVYYGSKSVRNYPLGETMTHILGYIGNISQEEFEDKRAEGYRRNSMIGKEGVEQFYDRELRGIDGYVQWIVDSRNRVKETISPAVGRPIPGKKLILSIDSKIQKDAEDLLYGQVGTIIVSRPTTGEILAMVSAPWYDPNIFIGKIDREKYVELINNPANPFWNKAIRGRYPPGSTFKLILSSGSLAEGRITANTTRFCGGGMWIENKFFKCTGQHGYINMYRAIQYSCNTYFYTMAYELGPNFIKKYAEIFGFNSTTGIDLPGEKIGIVPSADWKRRKIGEYWWDGDTLQYAIGQGYMSTTPIAVHMATSAIINDGVMYRPHVVKEIRSSQTDEVIYNNDKVVIKKLDIPQNVFTVVKEGMRMAVDGGTARNGAWSPYVKLAAKTSTAQTAQGKDHTWITIFGPYNQRPTDDMVAVTVMLEHSGGGGGSTAGPIATAMLRSILSGENAINVRNSIYNRMQLIYEQFRLQRELEALENSESEKNEEEKDGKKSKREEDNRIKYE
ncbi:penicillin-binding protein 2 [uncultured Brachyspira sp.]|uniref:penicillin-binding protein 2 n=1 Tax=uncultured Brachyspira sp. TaxID=221953 RepID=UPI0025988485|nr:penicillin-binding protein 2 [uncultured Brachyspira sp.]